MNEYANILSKKKSTHLPCRLREPFHLPCRLHEDQPLDRKAPFTHAPASDQDDGTSD